MQEAFASDLILILIGTPIWVQNVSQLLELGTGMSTTPVLLCLKAYYMTMFNGVTVWDQNHSTNQN